jgi:hypothetical protein
MPCTLEIESQDCINQIGLTKLGLLLKLQRKKRLLFDGGFYPQVWVKRRQTMLQLGELKADYLTWFFRASKKDFSRGLSPIKQREN